MGLTNEGLWSLTLQQFDLLTECYRERVKREDRRAGEVAAALYNVNNDWQKNPKGYDWLDFFPEWKERPTEQTEEQMLQAMDLWTRIEPLPS